MRYLPTRILEMRFIYLFTYFVLNWISKHQYIKLDIILD